MTEARPIRFGMIGCGSASVPVCEAIVASDLTELAAVYDVNHALADDLSQRFHVPAMETSLPGVFIVNSSHILNGTLNVNEGIKLAEQALPKLLAAANIKPAVLRQVA